MVNSLSIPQDIIGGIVEVVDDVDTLLQCASVSRPFLHSSRKWLFSDIHLQNAEQCERLYPILVQNPHIQSFIRSLTVLKKDHYVEGYNGLGPGYFKTNRWLLNDASSPSLPLILCLPLHCLKSFSFISSPNFTSWKDLSSDLRTALRNIMCLPSITKLHISALQDISIPFLSNLNHVKYLVLDKVLWDVSLNTSDACQPEELKSSEHVIDTVTEQFTWKLPMHLILVQVPTDMPPIQIMAYSRHIELHSSHLLQMGAGNDLMVRALDCSLKSPALLEHLTFKIEFIFFAELSVLGDIWSQMDLILTRPTCSHLQSVRIVIILAPDANIDGMEDMEVILPRSFPLLHAKGILVVEKPIMTKSDLNEHGVYS